MNSFRFSRPFRTLAGLVLALAPLPGIAGCGSLKHHNQAETKVVPVEIGQTPNLTTFGNHVYFAPQPATSDFKAFAERGIKTVINLRTDAEMQFDERAAVHAAGLKYMHVPIEQEEPPAEDLERIMIALDRAEKEPVLLHCSSSNRAGAVWAMYRAKRHGLGANAAIEEGKAAGLKSPKLEEVARDYIARQTKSK